MNVKTLTVIILLIVPSLVKSDGWVTDVTLNKAAAFKQCKRFIVQRCTLHTEVYLDSRSKRTGDMVIVYNAVTSKEIAEFRVKGIFYESAGNRCWLTDKAGESATYITVLGCRPR